jgi:hypothetical protein
MAVIVSSMDVIYVPLLKDLQRVLKYNDQGFRKLGKKMSEIVIVGSIEIWL